MGRAELRQKILATSNPAPQSVDVPGWGTVYVKPLMVSDVESFANDTDSSLRAARSLARMLCDETGELLFDPSSADDLFAINRLPMASLSTINAAVEKMNGTTAAAAEALGNG